MVNCNMFVLHEAKIKVTGNQPLRAIHKCLKRMPNMRVHIHVTEDLCYDIWFQEFTWVETRRRDVGWEKKDGVQGKLCKKVLRIHRNSTQGAVDDEHGRQSGKGKMVSAATNTVLGASKVRRKNEWDSATNGRFDSLGWSEGKGNSTN
jgi:hypothetical protein